jgi:hypothetical protein
MSRTDVQEPIVELDGCSLRGSMQLANVLGAIGLDSQIKMPLNRLGYEADIFL